MSNNATEVEETVDLATTDDALVRLAQTEISKDQLRLKQLVNPTTAQLNTELHGTVLSYLKDVARGLVEVRDWMYSYMGESSDHLEALDARLDIIEEFGGDTSILPDDAETLGNVIATAKFLAESLLRGPFPLQERDDEGKQKLAEFLILCESAKTIVQDSTLVAEEDEDELLGVGAAVEETSESN